MVSHVGMALTLKSFFFPGSKTSNKPETNLDMIYFSFHYIQENEFGVNSQT